MTLGDRLIVMHDGRAEQVGTPMAVYERPADTFVAAFIGSPPMNLLPATVTDGRPPPRRRPVWPSAGRAARRHRRHPRHPPRTSAPDGAAGLAVEVHAVETLGADAYAHGRIAGVAEPIVVRLPGNAPPAIGSDACRPPRGLDVIHLFEPPPAAGSSPDVRLGGKAGGQWVTAIGSI